MEENENVNPSEAPVETPAEAVEVPATEVPAEAPDEETAPESPAEPKSEEA